MVERKSIASFYEREAARYDRVRWSSPAGRYTDSVQRAIVSELLGDVENQRVLEVGVGTGRFTRELAKKGARVTGLDVSFMMLAEAKASLQGGARLAMGDGAGLPLRSERFDACLSVNVLSHVARPEKFLSEVARALRPSGFFVTNIPNLWSYYLLAGLLVNGRQKALGRHVYTRWYSLPFIRKIAREEGFVVEKVVGEVHIPRYLEAAGVWRALAFLDRCSRNSILRQVSPILFLKLRKQ